MGRLVAGLRATLAAAFAAWWYFAPHTLPAAVREWLPAPRADDGTHAAPPLYRWKDAQGAVHVTDAPPKDRPYETVRYAPDTNVVPAYRRPADGHPSD